MAATSTLARPSVPLPLQPRSFVPPGDRNVRLSHLDPRPLWLEPAAVESPWRSPTFWVAWGLVAPVVAIARLFERRR